MRDSDVTPPNPSPSAPPLIQRIHRSFTLPSQLQDVEGGRDLDQQGVPTTRLLVHRYRTLTPSTPPTLHQLGSIVPRRTVDTFTSPPARGMAFLHPSDSATSRIQHLLLLHTLFTHLSTPWIHPSFCTDRPFITVRLLILDIPPKSEADCFPLRQGYAPVFSLLISPHSTTACIMNSLYPKSTI